MNEPELRLRLQHDCHVGQVLAGIVALQQRVELVHLRLVGLKILGDLANPLREAMTSPTQRMVALLLLVTLEFLVGVAHQADVDELRPIRVLRAFTAHVDDAIAEGTPFLANDGDAAALEGLQITLAAGLHFAGDARENAAIVHADSGFDGLDDRHDAGVVARMGDYDVKVGDMVVFFHQILDRSIFVDGENAILELVFGTQDNVFHMHVSDCQLHFQLLSFIRRLQLMGTPIP